MECSVRLVNVIVRYRSTKQVPYSRGLFEKLIFIELVKNLRSLYGLPGSLPC